MRQAPRHAGAPRAGRRHGRDTPRPGHYQADELAGRHLAMLDRFRSRYPRGTDRLLEDQAWILAGALRLENPGTSRVTMARVLLVVIDHVVDEGAPPAFLRRMAAVALAARDLAGADE